MGNNKKSISNANQINYLLNTAKKIPFSGLMLAIIMFLDLRFFSQQYNLGLVANSTIFSSNIYIIFIFTLL